MLLVKYEQQQKPDRPRLQENVPVSTTAGGKKVVRAVQGARSDAADFLY